MITTHLLTKAKKLNNWDKNAGGGGLWDDTTHYTATVPTGKRWFFLGGMVNRAQSSTLSIYIRDSAGEQIIRLAEEGAASGLLAYPTSTFQIGMNYVLDAAEDIHMVFGTAQDANSWASCFVLEVKT